MSGSVDVFPVWSKTASIPGSVLVRVFRLASHNDLEFDPPVVSIFWRACSVLSFSAVWMAFLIISWHCIYVSRVSWILVGCLVWMAWLYIILTSFLDMRASLTAWIWNRGLVLLLINCAATYACFSSQLDCFNESPVYLLDIRLVGGANDITVGFKSHLELLLVCGPVGSLFKLPYFIFGWFVIRVMIW